MKLCEALCSQPSLLILLFWLEFYLKCKLGQKHKTFCDESGHEIKSGINCNSDLFMFTLQSEILLALLSSQ